MKEDVYTRLARIYLEQDGIGEETILHHASYRPTKRFKSLCKALYDAESEARGKSQGERGAIVAEYLKKVVEPKK